MNLAYVGGIALGFFAIIVSILIGGFALILYWDLVSVFITILGSYAALMASNPLSRVMSMGTCFTQAAKMRKSNLKDLLAGSCNIFREIAP